MSSESKKEQLDDPIAALTSSARSDIGQRREENQDSFGMIESSNMRLYAVADGMGGVKGGAVASNIAISVLKETLGGKNEIDEHELRFTVQKANARIFEEGVTNPAYSGMGTTFVSLVFVGTKLYIVNVGDSRAYRIRNGSIRQLTSDHTLVMELVRSGAITIPFLTC
jgi:PPM family protein phosphatase